MNISTLFFHTAQRMPEATAIANETSRLSFRDFEAAVRAKAAEFKAKGLKPGDRVLVFVPMSEALYIVVLALFQIGATAVFLDEWVSLKRLKLCCQLADCKGFIAPFWFRVLAFFVPVIRRIPLHFGVNYSKTESCPDIYSAKPEELALLTFTTGSTGTPKAASRSHGFLKAQFEALIEEIKPQSGDVVMTNLPIVLLINFGSGACSVIAKFNTKKAARFNPEPMLALVQKIQVNVLIGSPYLMLRLADSPDLQRKKSVKKIFTGGGPVFPDDAQKLSAGFPDAQIGIVYGSTEAEPIATASIGDLASKDDLIKIGGLCVGEIFQRISLKIIPIADAPVTADDLDVISLAPGSVGEITVAGDHVLRQYWNNEAAFKQNKIVDAQGWVWHRTGDAGFVGADGKLYLCGRCKQMIQREGRWISPFLVEYLLRQIPEPALGSVLEINGCLVLAVQKNAGTKTPAFENTLRQILPFAVDRVVMLDKIPRDPRHFTKIDYELLKQQVIHRLPPHP
jgi:olefin beta-lactone synthetase